MKVIVISYTGGRMPNETEVIRLREVINSISNGGITISTYDEEELNKLAIADTVSSKRNRKPAKIKNNDTEEADNAMVVVGSMYKDEIEKLNRGIGNIHLAAAMWTLFHTEADTSEKIAARKAVKVLAKDVLMYNMDVAKKYGITGKVFEFIRAFVNGL